MTGRRRTTRGTTERISGRFARSERERVDDGWPGTPSDEASSEGTTLFPERARSVITRNQSPDLPFNRSLNPYRGCEHGCIYCYARPSHAYLDLSPGLDFEQQIAYKANAAEQLERELAAPGYQCEPILLGANTDPYQPAERRLGVTRSVLEVLHATGHPAMVVTKGTGILRDLDLLADMAERRQASVAISLATLETGLKQALEPRAASSERRLEAIRQLAAYDIPVSVLVAPIIPALTDHEVESLVSAAVAAGAHRVDYTLLRLPHEVEPLFQQWLLDHYPDRAERVLNRLRELREGKLNDTAFGRRLGGTGPWAHLLAQRFTLAVRRARPERKAVTALDSSGFEPPTLPGQQLRLL